VYQGGSGWGGAWPAGFKRRRLLGALAAELFALALGKSRCPPCSCVCGVALGVACLAGCLAACGFSLAHTPLAPPLLDTITTLSTPPPAPPCPPLLTKSPLPKHRFKVERYMQLVFGLSACCLFVPVLYHQTSTKDVAPGAEE
jgi:hypothetical protein